MVQEMKEGGEAAAEADAVEEVEAVEDEEEEEMTGGAGAPAEKKKTGKAAKPAIETTHHFDGPALKPILDKLGLERMCCRRHMLSHVDLINII